MTMTLDGEVHAPPVPMRMTAEILYSRKEAYIANHSAWKSRIQTVDDIFAGDWEKHWPGLSMDDSTKPTVHNMIRSGAMGLQRLVAKGTPTIEIPVSGPKSRDEKAATKRRRRLQVLWRNGDIRRGQGEWALDRVTCGVMVAQVWTEPVFVYDSEKGTYEAQPREEIMWRPINPRHWFPGPAGWGGRPQTGVIALRRARADLYAECPEYAPTWDGYGWGEENDLEEVWWFEPGWCCRAIFGPNKQPAGVNGGRKKPVLPGQRGDIVSHRTIPLYDNNGRLRIPIIERRAVSHDRERRGEYDQAINPLGVMHTMMSLYLEMIKYNVAPPRWAIGERWEGLNKWGPSAVITAVVEPGDMPHSIGHLAPPVNPSIGAVLGQLEEWTRQETVNPRSRQGDPGGSTVTGRGITATQGALQDLVDETLHDEEEFLIELNSVLLCADQEWLPGERTISGLESGVPFTEKWDPARDVAGNYWNEVQFGLGAGMDLHSRSIYLAGMQQRDIIDEDTEREQSGWIKDPAGVGRKVAEAQTYKMILALVQAHAAQGNPEPLALMVESLDKGLSKGEVMRAVLESFSVPAPPEGGGGGGPDDILATLRGKLGLDSGGIAGPGAGQPQLGPGGPPGLQGPMPGAPGGGMPGATQSREMVAMGDAMLAGRPRG